jgi:hypothetical protein
MLVQCADAGGVNLVTLGLSLWLQDCSLICVDATKHVFRRADRPFGQYAEKRANDGEPAVSPVALATTIHCIVEPPPFVIITLLVCSCAPTAGVLTVVVCNPRCSCTA